MEKESEIQPCKQETAKTNDPTEAEEVVSSEECATPRKRKGPLEL